MSSPAKHLGQVADGRTPIAAHLGVSNDNCDAFGGNPDKFSVFVGAEVPSRVFVLAWLLPAQ